MFASSSLFSLPSGSPWSPRLLNMGRSLHSCRLPPWYLSLVFSLLRGPPLIPCPWSLSLFMSLPGRSSFCCRWRPLVGLETFRLLLLVSSLGVALFLSPFLVFRRCLSLPFVLSFALFCCGLFGILWVLLRLSSSCVPFGLFGCASFPSCPSSLFLSPRSPSRSLAPHAFSFFFRVVLEGAISSASRSLPSAPCSSYSSASSFSSSRPRSSLRACGVRGLAASWFFSAVLLCLPYFWPILDLFPSFFLLPFRCSVLIVQCLWFGFPVSEEVLYFGVYMQSFLGLYL